MPIVNQGGLSFKNGNGQWTRKVHWMIETTVDPGDNKFKFTVFYADVTNSFTDSGGTTWHPYAAGGGTYTPSAQTKSQFDTWVQQAGTNVSTWSPQNPYLPEG